jgi:predicted O-methyltransferase YrrM
MGESAQERRYTNNWFDQGVRATWERELIPRKADIARYLEVGVCEGQSMIWVLEHLLDDKPHGIAVGLDPYPAKRPLIFESAELTRANAKHNLAPWIDAGTARLVECSTWTAVVTGDEAFRVSRRHGYDLIYVDGSHHAWDTMIDLVLVYQLLRRGGLLILDDYSLKEWNGRPMTYVAAKAFEACQGARVEIEFVTQHSPEHAPRQVAYRKIK